MTSSPATAGRNSSSPSRTVRQSTRPAPSTSCGRSSDAAITVGGLPKFTASFGVTDTEPGEELPDVLRRADDALLLAKRQGRDQVVLHDAEVVPSTHDNAETNGSPEATTRLPRLTREHVAS